MQLVLGRQQTDVRLARFVSFYPRLLAAQTNTPAIADVSGVAPIATPKPAAPIIPLTVDLRYADGFAVRMPNGVSPFKPSPT
jgi:cell division protein FtsQ